MAHKLHTISLPNELSEFVDSDPELKLSKIAQSAILKIMDFRETDPYVQRLLKKIAALQQEIEKCQQP